MSCLGDEGPSFAIKVHPLPGEGLLDLMFRAVADNGFRKTNVVYQLMAGKLSNQAPLSYYSVAKKRIDVKDMARVLGHEIEDVDALILRRPDASVNFFGVQVSPAYLMNSRRVAPTFLKESGYQKAIWSLRCFSFDPVSEEALLTHCPDCHRILHSNRTMGVCFCSDCGSDLRDYPQDKVLVTDYPALNFVRALIDPLYAGPRDFALHKGIADLSRSELFTLIMTLGKLLDYEKHGRPAKPIIAKSKQFNISAASLLESARTTISWADNFAEVASILRSGAPPSRCKIHPLIENLPKSARRLRSVLATELHDVGLSGDRTRYFFRSKKIAPEGSLKNEQLVFTFSPAVLSDAASFGIPVGEMLSLYRIGSIRCPDDRLRRELDIKNDVRASSFDELSFRECPDGEDMALTDLVFASKVSAHPWAYVMSQVLGGNIDVSLSRETRWNFVKRLRSSDAEKVRLICHHAPDLDGDTMITYRDACFYLGVGYDTLTRIESAGLLPASELKLRSIWNFQEQYMGTTEIRARAAIGNRRPSTRVIWRTVDKIGCPRPIEDLGILRRQDGEVVVSRLLERTLGPIRKKKGANSSQSDSEGRSLQIG